MLLDYSDRKIKKEYKKMLSFDNIGKKSDKRWKFVSKLLCRVLPIVSGAIIPLPIPETLKVWIIFGCTVIVAVISAASELTVDTSTNALDATR